MPAISGQIGLILTVREPVSSAAWYQNVFGFEAAPPQVDADGRIAQICLRDHSSGFTLCLLSHGQNRGEAFDEKRTGLDHVEFFVSSEHELDAWTAWLDQLKVDNSGIKAPRYTTNRMVTFRDPDNIQLELFWEGPRI